MASTILSDNGVSSGSAGIKTTADSTGALALQTTTAGGAATTAVTIDTSQNVGIGTTSPSGKLDVRGDVYLGSPSSGTITYNRSTINWNYSSLVSTRNSSNASTTKGIEFLYDGDAIGNTTIGGTNAIWSFANASPTTGSTTSGLQSGLTYGAYYGHRWNVNGTEYMRINSNGSVGIGVAGQSAVSGVSGWLSVKNTNDNGQWGLAIETTGATTNRGIGIVYGNTPNSTGQEFAYWLDSTTLRFSVRSNGGIANYSANNVNLSDERTKTNIQNAGSYLAKICAIPVRTFKYKDQTDELLNLGVIAQEVEVVAPELVDASGFGETPEDGIPLKAIYQTDLQYALMKCIQEQQALITALTARITALENK